MSLKIGLTEDERMKLDHNNKGFALLKKLGWKEGEGLGSERQGIVNPIHSGGNVEKAITHRGLGAGPPRDAVQVLKNAEWGAKFIKSETGLTFLQNIMSTAGLPVPSRTGVKECSPDKQLQDKVIKPAEKSDIGKNDAKTISCKEKDMSHCKKEDKTLIKKIKTRRVLLPKSALYDSYGLNVTTYDSGHFIGGILKGSPAQAADLKINDKILEVNGKKIKNLTNEQVLSEVGRIVQQVDLQIEYISLIKPKLIPIKSEHSNNVEGFVSGGIQWKDQSDNSNDSTDLNISKKKKVELIKDGEIKIKLEEECDVYIEDTCAGNSESLPQHEITKKCSKKTVIKENKLNVEKLKKEKAIKRSLPSKCQDLDTHSMRLKISKKPTSMPNNINQMPSYNSIDFVKKPNIAKERSETIEIDTKSRDILYEKENTIEEISSWQFEEKWRNLKPLAVLDQASFFKDLLFVQTLPEFIESIRKPTKEAELNSISPIKQLTNFCSYCKLEVLSMNEHDAFPEHKEQYLALQLNMGIPSFCKKYANCPSLHNENGARLAQDGVYFDSLPYDNNCPKNINENNLYKEFILCSWVSSCKTCPLCPRTRTFMQVSQWVAHVQSPEHAKAALEELKKGCVTYLKKYKNTPAPMRQSIADSLSLEFHEESKKPPFARSCTIRQWSCFTGYGFRVADSSSKPGHYIDEVVSNGPADSTGLKAYDRIISVNGLELLNKTHWEVVNLIKASENGRVKLLIVSPRAFNYFMRNNIRVCPSMDNLKIIIGPANFKLNHTDLSQVQKHENNVNKSHHSVHYSSMDSYNSNQSLYTPSIITDDEVHFESSASTVSPPILTSEESKFLSRMPARRKVLLPTPSSAHSSQSLSINQRNGNTSPEPQQPILVTINNDSYETLRQTLPQLEVLYNKSPSHNDSELSSEIISNNTFTMPMHSIGSTYSDNKHYSDSKYTISCWTNSDSPTHLQTYKEDNDTHYNSNCPSNNYFLSTENENFFQVCTPSSHSTDTQNPIRKKIISAVTDLSQSDDYKVVETAFLLLEKDGIDLDKIYMNFDPDYIKDTVLTNIQSGDDKLLAILDYLISICKDSYDNVDDLNMNEDSEWQVEF